MSEPCWNYCSVCGRKIPVGEKCYGVKRSSSALVVGESICKDCIEPENFEIPASDVRPVVRGRFVHDGPRFAGGVDWWHCSNCGSLVSGVETRFAFCPHCGADMRPKNDGMKNEDS